MGIGQGLAAGGDGGVIGSAGGGDLGEGDDNCALGILVVILIVTFVCKSLVLYSDFLFGSCIFAHCISYRATVNIYLPTI